MRSANLVPSPGLPVERIASRHLDALGAPEHAGALAMPTQIAALNSLQPLNAVGTNQSALSLATPRWQQTASILPQHFHQQ